MEVSHRTKLSLFHIEGKKVELRNEHRIESKITSLCMKLLYGQKVIYKLILAQVSSEI